MRFYNLCIPLSFLLATFFWILYLIGVPVSFVLLITGLLFIFGVYLGRCSAHLYGKLALLQCDLFLNGFRLWDWEKSSTFYRLGMYIGHGVCYEASAALMLALKGRYKTRFVYGRTLDGPDNLHCWVEVKAYGIWWVLDSTWVSISCRPIPILIYRVLFKTRAVRKISEEEFFSHEIAIKMAEMIKNPKTSYIFHDLSCFRRAHWKNDTDDSTIMVIEDDNWGELLCTEENPGWNPFLIGIFKPSGGKPVTQRIIREFVTRSNRLSPKRRTFRKAIVMEKMINRSMDEATALHEKTGETIQVVFTGLKTFELTELAP